MRDGAYRIVTTAITGAFLLGMDEEDIHDCVLSLTANDFHKTMPSSQKPGLFQDVYKPVYENVGIYLKLQGSPDGKTVVISFKRES